ncbi:MAG: HAD-IIIC family phosphatase [Verrucomicrobiota bacterium JB024]|nr:HAD-IIIC family phosphatase [Verrucomicrobiota bacterium JB024]
MLSLTEDALRQLAPPALAALLRASPTGDTARMLWPVAAALPEMHLPLATAFLDAFGSEEPVDALAWLDAQTGVHGSSSPLSAWLGASLAELAGDDFYARSLWEAVTDADGYGLPGEALLALARVQLRLGDPSGALVSLRDALRLGEAEWGFWSRSDRFYQKLAPKLSAPERPLKLALLSSATTTFYAAALRMAAVRDGYDPTVYEPPFGAWRQDILDPGSALYAFEPDIVILATHWRDAHLPAFAALEDGASLGPLAPPPVLDELKNFWSLLGERLGCPVLQHSFDLPADDSGGALSANDPTGRIRRLRELNESLRREAPSGVTVVDVEALAAGSDAWSDARQWLMHKQHPAMAALPRLADADLALIRAATGLARKVLVLDLDNTLWGGVIGEDGLEGIRVGPPHADGEAFVMLQHYARELKERGVLLAVCSKNNAADARLPFERHESMVLKLDDFAAFVANWEDKPANLIRLSEQLGVGLDSFVFVDDNPVERALVRRELPEVAVPELGHDPARFVETLARGRWFEALTLSGEDRERHAAYQANAARRELEAAVPDLEAFLRQLQMEIAHGPITERNLDRVAQLVSKTNQFNLTTRRHPPEALRQFAADPAGWTQAFRLKDRYGDNGLVGVVIAVPAGESAWEIDTFLMSCRVIGRGLRRYMLATLLNAARERNITRVTGLYAPTPKNAMVAAMYPDAGFTPEPTDGGAQRFVFDPTTQELPVVPEGMFEVLGS